MRNVQCSATGVKRGLRSRGDELLGFEFFDRASFRCMKLVTEGSLCAWLVWKHPDGQWVTYRKATSKDLLDLAAATTGTIHERAYREWFHLIGLTAVCT